MIATRCALSSPSRLSSLRHRIRAHRTAFAVCSLLVVTLGAGRSAWSQAPADTAAARMLYTKHEYRIAMRDGVRLYTAVYVPRDSTARYPFLIRRTRYGVRSYGPDTYARLGTAEKTIKVHRARVMHKMSVRSVAELTRVAEVVGIRPEP